DNSRPLIVDSNGDGICDAVNPNVIPAVGMQPGPTQAVSLELVKIPPTGIADFTPGTFPLYWGGCNYGTDTMPPSALCPPQTFLRLWVGLYRIGVTEPVIWAPPQVLAPPDPRCGGLPFDALANNVADGWLCVAVAFVDGVGNRSVSRAIRLCLDKAASGIPCA